MGYFENIISGEQRGFLPAILRLILLKISWLYLVVIKLRRWLYFIGILRSESIPCKVISVGNVVAGGSGKTPAVIAIARMLRDKGALSVAILSRGYRSKAPSPAVVSDGENILLDAVNAGDEPYLLSHSLPGVPVLIGRDRIQTGLMAIQKWGCQVAILDDGFQYLRLARDVDIIAVDAARPFGFNHVLPRGYLREPLSVLKRADLILLTRVDQCENISFLREKLSRIAPSVPIFESVHSPRSLRSFATEEESDVGIIKDKNVLAVCGIANPESFAETLRSLDPAKVELLAFPDHHEYPPASIQAIRQRFAGSSMDFIVTTEKDAQKLRSIAELPVLVLAVDLKLSDSAAGSFMELIRKLCNL